MTTANKNLSFFDKKSIPNASNFKFGIVVSKWNEKITNNLLTGVLDTLYLILRFKKHCCFNVPGSFELFMVQKINEKKIRCHYLFRKYYKGRNKTF